MFDATTIVVCALVGLVAAWRFGLLERITRGAPPRAASAPGALADLDRYDSTTLGLAFHRAVRREADDQVARSMADASRVAATAAYTSPFSGGPGPPPAP